MDWNADTATSDRYQLGRGDPQTITETVTPSSVTFNTAQGRDKHVETRIRLRNPTTTSASTDATVSLDLMFGATVAKTESETQTISIPAESSQTVRFHTAGGSLTPGHYRVQTSLTGTTIVHDQTEVETRPSTFAWEKRRDGRGVIVDDGGVGRLEYPADWAGVRFPGGVEDQDGNRVTTLPGDGLRVSGTALETDNATLAGAGLAVSGTALQTDNTTLAGAGLAASGSALETTHQLHTEVVTINGTGASPLSVPHTAGVIPDSAQITAASLDAAADTFFVSNKTSSAIEVSYNGTAPPSGTGNVSYELTLVY